MEKCPKCSFRKVKERTVLDKDERPVETASVCKNCGYVLRRTKIKIE